MPCDRCGPSGPGATGLLSKPGEGFSKTRNRRKEKSEAELEKERSSCHVGVVEKGEDCSAQCGHALRVTHPVGDSNTAIKNRRLCPGRGPWRAASCQTSMIRTWGLGGQWQVRFHTVVWVMCEGVGSQCTEELITRAICMTKQRRALKRKARRPQKPQFSKLVTNPL